MHVWSPVYKWIYINDVHTVQRFMLRKTSILGKFIPIYYNKYSILIDRIEYKIKLKYS